MGSGNPLGGTRGASPVWVDDENGVRDVPDEEFLHDEDDPSSRGWHVVVVNREGVDYIVDSRDFFIDFNKLADLGYLDEVPASASTDNQSAGSNRTLEGPYSWYVDKDGNVRSILFSFPESNKTGFQDVFPSTSQPAEPASPTIAGSSGVNEGSAYTLDLIPKRPGASGVTSWEIDWGDGAIQTILGGPSSTTHIYADGTKTYTISAKVTDEDGILNTNRHTVTVNNVAPILSLSGAPTTSEGSTYVLTLGTVTDPGDDTVTQYVVRWGDGTLDVYQGTGSVTHTYADGTTNPVITVDLVDEDGTHVSAGSRTLSVSNIVPTIELSGGATVDEGSPYTLTLGAVTDPGSDTVKEYVVRWGDGTSDAYARRGGVTHVYADGNSSPTIVVDLLDEDGTHPGAGSLSLVVENVAPTIALVGTATVDEGSPYTLTLGAVTDPGADTVTTYVVHWGDGASDTYTSGGGVTHTYADGVASRTITVDLVDEDGTYLGAGSLGLTVNNVPPTVALSGAARVDEGSVYTLTLGAVTDPGDDSVTQYIVRWGDGAIETFGAGGPVQHTYADGPTSPIIAVDLVDEDGTHVGAGSLPVSVLAVDDVAPTIALSGAASVDEGSAYTLNLGEVTDPGDDIVSQYVVNWGDGSSDTFTDAGDVDHVYADGVTNPTITIDLVDEDGAHRAPVTLSVTVDNVAPTIALSGVAAVNEGAPYTLTLGAVTDPGADTVTPVHRPLG